MKRKKREREERKKVKGTERETLGGVVEKGRRTEADCSLVYNLKTKLKNEKKKVKNDVSNV